jgi:glycerate-2-kinase
VATDGEDGPTPAAGAVVSGGIVPYAKEKKLAAEGYLDRNDSYNFFVELDALINEDSWIGTQKNETIVDLAPCLIVTGSTGTNVNDLLFILTYE